jgi:hypothetical protein
MAWTDTFEAAVQGRIAWAASGTGMAGGSATALFAWLGSQDIVAGIGAVVAVGSLILSALHRRAMRRLSERDMTERRRIEIARLTPEEREAYRKLL